MSAVPAGSPEIIGERPHLFRRSTFGTGGALACHAAIITATYDGSVSIVDLFVMRAGADRTQFVPGVPYDAELAEPPIDGTWHWPGSSCRSARQTSPEVPALKEAVVHGYRVVGHSLNDHVTLNLNLSEGGAVSVRVDRFETPALYEALGSLVRASGG